MNQTLKDNEKLKDFAIDLADGYLRSSTPEAEPYEDMQDLHAALGGEENIILVSVNTIYFIHNTLNEIAGRCY